MNQQSYSMKQIYKGTFDEAVADIAQALQKEGFGILTQIDVRETLKKKLNVNYPKYMILGACNPPNAYKALQAEKEIGLLLPCNVIVYEDGGKVYISVMKPTAALTLSKNETVAKIAKQVESKLIAALRQAISNGRN
jgi:uncharacterized protein (DUF302 family)